MLYRLVKTGWGWCGVAGSGNVVSRLYLPAASASHMRTMIHREFGNAAEDPRAFAMTARLIERYFAGRDIEWDADSIALEGTDFQVKVWRAAMRIPYGETRTYGWIAKQIGSRGASRAVGAALGRNPIPLIVPCHRVVRSDRSLGGFSAEQGVFLKRKLLELENAC